MTLPNQIQLTIDPRAITSEDKSDMLNYMKKLIYDLTEYMQQTNSTVNGSTRLVPFTNIPYSYIYGSTAQNATTVYSNTTMWSRRSNLMNQNWFDITWTGSTDTGNLWVQLPYYSQTSSNQPFICVIENNGLTFTAGYTYLVGNLIPNTNTIEIRQCGSGLPSIPMPIPASGSLRGSIVYAGQQAR